jgi:O-antigen ligase
MRNRSTIEALSADPYVAAAVLVISAIIFLLALKDRRYVLFSYLFFLPLATMPIMAGRLAGIPVLSVQNIVMGLGLYATFLTRSRNNRMDRNLRTALIWYWAVVAVVVLHGMFYLNDLPEARYNEGYGIYDYLRNFLIVPALAWLSFVVAYRYAAAGAARATEYLRYAGIATLGFAILVLGSVAYYYTRFRSLDVVRDMVAIFIGSHSNDFSFAFAMAAPILIAGAISKRVVRRRDRIFFWLALGGLVAAVLFSYSRSGYIALMLAVFGFALLAKRSLLWLLVPALAGLILFAPASVMERAQSGFESSGSRTSPDWNMVTAGRLQMGQASLEIITSDPLQMAFGGGRLKFPRATYTRFGVDSPHSAYTEALLDAGIVGFVPIFALFLLLLSRNIKGMRRLRASEFFPFYAAATVSLGSYLILGLTGRSFFPSPHLMFVWQVSGFALGLLRYDMTRAQQLPASAVKTPTCVV